MTLSSFNVSDQLTACRVLSDSNLAGTYAQPFGSAVGATLINSGGLAQLTIDSVVLKLGDRVALFNQTRSNENGIYAVTNPGDSLNKWVLTRSNDLQSIEQLKAGLYFSIGAGTTYAGAEIVIVEPIPSIIGGFTSGKGNIVFQNAANAGGGGGGTVNAATADELAFYAASGTTISGLANGTTGQVLTATTSAAPSWSTVTGLTAIASHDILSNITSGSALPIANTLTATIDAAIGATQGDILYRNSTVWTVLAPGTSGYVLSTGGAGANPSWIAAGGGGGGVNAGLINQAAVYASAGSTVSGSYQFLDSSSALSIDYDARRAYLTDGTTVVIDWSDGGATNLNLNDTGGVASVMWDVRALMNTNGTTGSVNWGVWALVDGAGNTSLRWGAAGRQLLATNGSTVNCKWDLTTGVQFLGLQVKEGANAKQGVSTLSSGTVTVSNTSVTAVSRIFLTAQETGALTGIIRVSARTPSTSFTISSTVGSDTAVVAWEIFEPSSTL